MADDPERPRADAQRRTRAQKLAALLRAEDAAALGRFRKQRLAADAEIKDEDLALLRELLELLALQLENGDPEGWQRVHSAFEVLRPPAEPEEQAPPDSDQPTMRDAEPEEVERPSLERPPSDPPPIAAKTNTENPSPWLRWSRGAEDSSPTPRTTPAPRAELQSSPSPSPPPSTSSEPPPRWQPPDYRSEGPTVTTPVDVGTPDDTAALDARATLRTDEVTTAHALPQSRDPLPFRRLEDDPTKELTYVSRAHGLALDVEEYAALCAERDRAPERQLQIHERYDVFGDRCREGLDRAYQLRFMRDPGLRSLWQQHYVRFSSALRRLR